MIMLVLRAATGRWCAGRFPPVLEVQLHQGDLRHVLPVHGGGDHPGLHDEGEIAVQLPLVSCVRNHARLARSDPS